MSGSSGVLEFLAWALRNFSLGVNLVSYKSPLDFTPNFGSSFGEGIGPYTDFFNERMKVSRKSNHYPNSKKATFRALSN